MSAKKRLLYKTVGYLLYTSGNYFRGLTMLYYWEKKVLNVNSSLLTPLNLFFLHQPHTHEFPAKND